MILAWKDLKKTTRDYVVAVYGEKHSQWNCTPIEETRGKVKNWLENNLELVLPMPPYESTR